MSNSVRRNPILKYGNSNKKARSYANRKLRRWNKKVISSLMYGTFLQDDDEFTDIEEWGHDWWEYPNIVKLDDCDYFKKLREVSDVYNFPSEGLSRVFGLHERIRDFTHPNYTWKTRRMFTTTLFEAIQERNWELLKHYYIK